MSVPSERDVERILGGDDRARAACVKHFHKHLHRVGPAVPRPCRLPAAGTRVPEPTVAGPVVTAAPALEATGPRGAARTGDGTAHTVLTWDDEADQEGPHS
ncbi:hypothetical protein Acsp04_33730 [Actinomadura sp. NBRC 104425]|nr:hypothetical protein Acsp04_33730 [Actinomadura sp. NBRC 104425]